MNRPIARSPGLVVLLLFAASVRAEDADAEKIAKSKQRLVSFEFVDTPLEDALKFLSNFTEYKVSLDPKALAAGMARTPISLRLADVPLENAVKWVAHAAKLNLQINADSFALTKDDVAPAQGTPEHDKQAQERTAAIQNKLKHLVTFEFLDTPLLDAVGFLQTVVKVNVVFDDDARKSPPVINLRVQDMEAGTALKWTLKLAEMEYEIRDDAIYIRKQNPLAAGVITGDTPVKAPAPAKEPDGF